MKVEKLLLLSGLLSISNAAATPNPDSPSQDAYYQGRAGHHLGLRDDYNQGDGDVVYETTTVYDCGSVTSIITEYSGGVGYPTSVPAGIPVPSGTDGFPVPSGAGGAGGLPEPTGTGGFPVPTEIPALPFSGFSEGFSRTDYGVPTTAATSTNSPPTDSPSNCANTPTNRHCWDNCTIGTDYEKTWPVTGVTVEYWLTVENGTASPDGFSRQVITFNGTIPGPLITANWGDTIKVHVKNNLQNNGTGIHWHGFRQLNTNDQDGTNGITECPLAPGQTKTYTFVATTYGTSWYHSHFSAQYGDGAVGPVVIKGPASGSYDEDLGPVVIQDWYHQTIFQKEWIAQHVGPVVADNYLLNGINAAADGSAGGNRLTFKFTKGQKYLLRLINAGTDNFMKVGIDGHNFTVVAVDFVPITPFVTDYIPLGIGQRYDVIVEASADVGNYWFRAMAQSDCADNLNNGLGTANGIITYDGASSDLPTSTAPTMDGHCHDIDAADLVPVVAKAVPSTTFTSSEILPVAAPAVVNTSYGDNVFVWAFDDVPIDIDWNNPTLLQLENGVTNFTAAENVVKLDTPNVWTYWIVQNTYDFAHPMHLHGHDFSLLGQGTGTFDASTATLNYATPPRRDTAMLIESGWTVVAFETDNPGAWLFHCHIGWHVGGGLSLQFLEREADILSTLHIDSSFADTCQSFSAYDDSSSNVYGKTDSGL